MEEIGRTTWDVSNPVNGQLKTPDSSVDFFHQQKITFSRTPWGKESLNLFEWFHDGLKQKCGQVGALGMSNMFGKFLHNHPKDQTHSRPAFLRSNALPEVSWLFPKIEENPQNGLFIMVPKPY